MLSSWEDENIFGGAFEIGLNLSCLIIAWEKINKESIKKN